jgi:hypothetical protein
MALLLLTLFLSTMSRGVGGTWIPSGIDLVKLLSLILFGFTPVSEQFLYGHLLLVSPWQNIPFEVWAILGVMILVGALVGWRYLIRRTGFHLSYWLIIIFGFFPPVFAVIIFAVLDQPFFAPRPMIGAATWLLMGISIGWAEWPKPAGSILVVALLALNIGSLWGYESEWIKDYSKTAFQTIDPGFDQSTVLVLDRYYLSPLWNFYRTENSPITAFGIAPTKEGPYTIKQLVPDDSLQGSFLNINCNEFPNDPVWLYDPSGRIKKEMDRWPKCILNQVEKVYDPVTLKWETVVGFP